MIHKWETFYPDFVAIIRGVTTTIEHFQSDERKSMFHLICRDRLGVWSKNSRGCGKTMECRIISEKAGSGRTTVSSQGSNLGKIVFGWKYNTLLTWQSDFTLLQSGQNWTASRGFLQNTKILLWENVAMDSWKLNFWLKAWMQKNLVKNASFDHLFRYNRDPYCRIALYYISLLIGFGK